MENKYQKWYNKWGKSYTKYMAFQLIRVAILFFILLSLSDLKKIIMSKKDWSSLTDLRKLPFISMFLIPLIFHFHNRWKLMRLKKTLSEKAELLPEDIKRVRKIANKYQSWKTNPVKIILLSAFISPFAFFCFLYIILGVKNDNFSLLRFITNEFESLSVIFLVFVIFYLAGIFFARKYWREYLLTNYEEVIQLSNFKKNNS